ncbi:MAG: rhomboid family intramembrane serine protease [Bacteroidia bacterium]|nr:rhomboid family intramembrane serine protease [Bacteroidia bacterium]
MDQYSPSRFGLLSPVVKNLLIINVLLFIGTLALGSAFNYDLVRYLGLYYFQSEYFYPFQLLTYMFMHANFGHIFFNMFALWMFGNVLESYWSGKKFLLYYFVCGIGAAVIQMVISHIEVLRLTAGLSPDIINEITTNGGNVLKQGMNYSDSAISSLNLLFHIPTIGASGAVFGLLLAFGMLFPNALLYIYFAIPIKAKYFVIFYGFIELYLGIINQEGDNVAHFAHLGGMLFGFILIMLWKKR